MKVWTLSDIFIILGYNIEGSCGSTLLLLQKYLLRCVPCWKKFANIFQHLFVFPEVINSLIFVKIFKHAVLTEVVTIQWTALV